MTKRMKIRSQDKGDGGGPYNNKKTRSMTTKWMFKGS
jgi:hypothetical protein